MCRKVLLLSFAYFSRCFQRLVVAVYALYSNILQLCRKFASRLFDFRIDILGFTRILQKEHRLRAIMSLDTPHIEQNIGPSRVQSSGSSARFWGTSYVITRNNRRVYLHQEGKEQLQGEKCTQHTHGRNAPIKMNIGKS